jgi:4-hydroxy-3-polyprenylbenzoate decarboxylase
MSHLKEKKPLIIGITGASGFIYGVRLLRILHEIPCIETHLIISKAAQWTRHYETDVTVEDLHQLADVVHPISDLAACLSSGSFRSHGMIIAPCSMNTLAEIAHGITPNLIARAADVILKERKRLVLMVRESPLHLVHLENMCKVTQLGAIIAPPMPAFYQKPQTIDDIIDHSVGRVLDLFDIDSNIVKRWNPMKKEQS